MVLSQIKKLIRKSFKQSLWFLVHPKTFYRMKTARVHPTPIFILGHEKSGTTAIAALLAKISGQSVTIDPVFRIDPEGYLQDKLFSQGLSFCQFVQSHKFYFSTCLNKDPKLTFFYDDLRQCFPSAKFIFVIRDPRDTIRSFLNRRGIPGKFEKLQNMEEDIQVRIARIGSRPPVAGNNYIEKLANRWNLAADTYIDHKNEFSLISYEDFLQDKIGTISELARQVGLNPINDITDCINVQYQPRGDRNISWLEFFGTDNLRYIETICRERINYFGYDLSPTISKE